MLKSMGCIKCLVVYSTEVAQAAYNSVWLRDLESSVASPHIMCLSIK